MLRASVAPEGVQSSASSSLGSKSLGADRFNLLLLEDGEYYFRDHASYYWKEGRRCVWQGQAEGPATGARWPAGRAGAGGCCRASGALGQ